MSVNDQINEDLADWSVLPSDIYVVSAKRVHNVGFDVLCCSVPMVTAPEVRYVRADTIKSPVASPENEVEAVIELAIRQKTFEVGWAGLGFKELAIAITAALDAHRAALRAKTR